MGMCGIFGVVWREKRPSDNALAQGKGAVAYRGKDGDGVYEEGRCHLAHHRLSIIDLSTGDQPMTDASGRYVTVFNGEVYNYMELRDELLAKGAVFRTQSDTEVLAAGLAVEGPAFFGRLEAMAAVAVWDRRDEELWLYRDPLGKKPLFLFDLPDGGVAFSNSLDSFRELDGFDGVLNEAAVLLYLRLGVTPSPMTIYRKARRLREGCVAVFSARTGKWREEEVGGGVDYGVGGEGLDDAGVARELTRALKVRLRSDVPLGLTFSGGVDSGLLACLAKEAGTPVGLFNIDYSPGHDVSEERLNARKAAQRLGFALVEHDFRPGALFSDLAEAYAHYDEPCSQLGLVYAWQIFRTMRGEGLKVVLTGNGGDELFFGYHGEHLVRQRGLLYQWALRLLPGAALPPALRRVRREGWPIYARERLSVLPPGELGLGREAAEGAEVWLDEWCGRLARARAGKLGDVVLHQKLFLDGAATNYRIPDIGGLMAQVEVRAPFLDCGLVRKAAVLPEAMRTGSLRSSVWNKAVLKRLYMARLGKDLAFQEKRGMASGIRWDRWIIEEKPAHELLRTTLGRLEEFGLRAPWFLSRFETYCSGGGDAATAGDQAVAGFMLALWLIKQREGLEGLRAWMEPISGFVPAGAGQTGSQPPIR